MPIVKLLLDNRYLFCVVHYRFTGGIDADVHSAVTAKTSTAL